MKSALSRLLENHGMFDSLEMENEIIRDFPNLIVGVKMGCSPRFSCKVSEVRREIGRREGENHNDYCRDVFLSCDSYDALRLALGVCGE